MRSATGIIQFPLDLLTKSGAATSLQGAAKGMRSEGLTDDEMWRRNTRRIGCVGGGGAVISVVFPALEGFLRRPSVVRMNVAAKAEGFPGGGESLRVGRALHGGVQ